MPLAITSLGAVTSVGHDVVTACAAIRASMVRSAPIVGTNVLDLETGKVVPVVGHPLRGLAEGFGFTGLWVRLAELAIRDGMAHGRLPGLEDDRFWARCDVMVA